MLKIKLYYIRQRMKILGISAFYHDSAAVIVADGRVVAAAQEERFTRKKHDFDFPRNAIGFCLDYSGIDISDLDAVAFYDKPLLKFERLLETYYRVAPKGLNSFIKAMPVWLKEKMFLKRLILQELEKIEPGIKKKIKTLFPEHHLSHAASTYYPSTFDESAILTIDGVGEWSTATIAYGNKEAITILKELHFPHSVGLLYSAFTYFLGFKVNSGEYKLMGLAPYGNKSGNRTKEFVRIIKEKLVTLHPDGSIYLHQQYFHYAEGLRMIDEGKWEKLFGFARRKPESDMESHHCDLALAIQIVTEEIVLAMAEEAKRLTGSKHLCLSGGVALNCVANGKLLETGIFKEIYIQPAAGDAGGALGAALAAQHLYFNKTRETGSDDNLRGAYLGPDYSRLDIQKTLRKHRAKAHYYASFDELSTYVSELMIKGNVVGWFQGRMEFGPRALGNRSIIADPRNEEMQLKLNVKIKYRESFRPFAPSVLEEDMSDYFDIKTPTSPYMLLVAPIKEEYRMPIPADYEELGMKERLYHKRSILPAITHVDFSARIQSVNSKTNPRYYKLISAFKKKSGIGVVVNTSFNVRGEPIVCSPEDAYQCFMDTEMDVLVLGDFVLLKKEQDIEKRRTFERSFKLD